MASDIISGLLQLFIQPLFYFFLIVAVLMADLRVNRERHDFRVRVYSLFDDIFETIVPGLLFGLIGSVVLIAVGVVLTPGMVALIAALYVLSLVPLQLRLISPAFVVGFAVLIAYAFPDIHTGIGLVDGWIKGIRTVSLPTAALLLGILIVMEGILIRVRGRKTTPRLLPGKRGKTIGAHEAQKFWFVPLCLLLPGGGIPGVEPWPLTGGGGDGFSLLLVPFGFGFYRLVTDMAPKRAVANAAAESLWLGIVVIIMATIALYEDLEWPALVAAGLAIVCRIFFIIYERVRRKRNLAYFRQRDDGLTVLGVIPGSPAEKLGIRVGEWIRKVNGQQVQSESEFYEALQQNAAFCKIEVIDEAGEVRFAQGALYDGIHHELGLLFVSSPKTAL